MQVSRKYAERGRRLSENPSDSQVERGGCAGPGEVALRQSLEECAITLVGRQAASAIAEVSTDRAGLFRRQLVIQIFPESAHDL
jgi:hypothetical protein